MYITNELISIEWLRLEWALKTAWFCPPTMGRVASLYTIN